MTNLTPADKTVIRKVVKTQIGTLRNKAVAWKTWLSSVTKEALKQIGFSPASRGVYETTFKTYIHTFVKELKTVKPHVPKPKTKPKPKPKSKPSAASGELDFPTGRPTLSVDTHPEMIRARVELSILQDKLTAMTRENKNLKRQLEAASSSSSSSSSSAAQRYTRCLAKLQRAQRQIAQLRDSSQSQDNLVNQLRSSNAQLEMQVADLNQEILKHKDIITQLKHKGLMCVLRLTQCGQQPWLDANNIS